MGFPNSPPATRFGQAGTSPTNPTGYLTPKGAAEYLSISLPELERLRRVGGGPRFCKISAKLVRYSIRDLDAWMEGFAVANTSEAHERDHAGQGVAGE